MLEGILGLIHLVVAVWAILNIIGSSASGAAKVIWSLAVILFPIIGLIVWFIAGPKSSASMA